MGSHVFGKVREGLGNSRKESPYLNQKIAAVWLHELYGRSRKHPMETPYQLRRRIGVNSRKGSRLGLIENEGFGLE